MSSEWVTAEGTGWIPLEGFGQINPRSDEVNGGRYYFTAKTLKDEYAMAQGEEISGDRETWSYELDQPFVLSDYDGNCVEVTISQLRGGRYAVRHRPTPCAPEETGGW